MEAVNDIHDAMMISLTPDDNPSIWKHLTNMPLLDVASSVMAISALFLVIAAVFGELSVILVLCCVPTSLEIAETKVGFASREL